MSSKIDIYYADDRTLNLALTQDGSPYDLTGAKLYFTVKNKKTDLDGDALITKTQLIHTDPTEGETNIILDTTDTDIDTKDYYYDIQVKDSLNKITTFTVGTFFVRLKDLNKPLTIIKGDDLLYPLNLADDDGIAIDITGYTFKFRVTEDGIDEDTSPLISVDVTSHTDAVNGQTEIVVPSASTDTLDIQDYIYSIRMINTSSNQTTIIRSKLTVQGDVTRSTS